MKLTNRDGVAISEQIKYRFTTMGYKSFSTPSQFSEFTESSSWKDIRRAERLSRPAKSHSLNMGS